jgi:uncharacterized protein (UPF0218 family)
MTDPDDGDDGEHERSETVLLRLPPGDRDAFKDPLGPVLTDTDDLLAAAGDPVVAVGDIVSYHLVEAGFRPRLSVVDGLTERSPTDETVRDALGSADDRVWNPAARLTAEAVEAVRDGVVGAGPTTLAVDGEEDLLTLPAILGAPDDASVVYGQPGEGMVHVRVDGETRDRARTLFDRLEGDHASARDLLGLAD